MTSTTRGSLFGAAGVGTTTQPANSLQNSPASMLGNTPATQTPSGGSLFAKQPQAQPQLTHSSLFGQNTTQTSVAQAAQLSNQTQPAFFNSLLERGKKRPLSAIGLNSNFDELPTLQLGLDDIRKKARELGTKESNNRQQYAANSRA